MAKITRRSFFRRASVGVAAAGALVAAPQFLHSPAPPAMAATTGAEGRVAPAAGATSATLAPSQPVVAYIRNAAQGEIAIYTGTREIIRKDPDLVSRLLQAGL